MPAVCARKAACPALLSECRRLRLHPDAGFQSDLVALDVHPVHPDLPGVTEIFPEAHPDEEERQDAAVHQDAFGPALLDENSVVRPDEPLRHSAALPDELGNAVPAVGHLAFAVSRREQKRPMQLRQQDAVPLARPAEPALPVEAVRPDAVPTAEHPLASRLPQEQWLPEQLRALPPLEREQARVRGHDRLMLEP
jgi:hypothetical protein